MSLLAVLLLILLNSDYFPIIKEFDDLKQFNDYLRTYNKTYNSTEYYKRLQYFKESLKTISELNQLSNLTTHGLTKFSDMSKEEFTKTMLLNEEYSFKCSPRQQYCHTDDVYKNKTVFNFGDKLPQKFDWRSKGVIGPVGDQQKCNVCWAFSIIGVMEAMAVIKGFQKTTLSVQELIDCSGYGNHGCNHYGSLIKAFNYMCDHKMPITTEADYPLTLSNERCTRKITEGRKIDYYAYHCNVMEEEILATIAFHGPVVAKVNALDWGNYNGGIIQTNCDGDRSKLNHAIQIVGYDLTGDVPYYIVKNSWGEDYGQHGYVMVAVGNNMCGIANDIAFFDVI